MESRRAPRTTRVGSVMLYPRTGREEHEPTDPTFEDPAVVASVSNVSRTGLGLVHEEALSPGTLFEIDWEAADGECVPLTLQVVHTRPIAPRMYRTGARVVSEQLIPVEVTAADAPAPVVSRPPTVRVVQPAAISGAENCGAGFQACTAADAGLEACTTTHLSDRPALQNVMRIDAPAGFCAPDDSHAPMPAGTLRVVPGGTRFATTQRVQGASPCGFDRQVEVCRVGRKLWIYIHSPGKKNGWGIYVDPNEFEAAMNAVRGQISHPTVMTLAA
ncbi:MAG TPA: hypothetical protein VGI81_18985 [Tepidisphaeraceae bacterium]